MQKSSNRMALLVATAVAATIGGSIVAKAEGPVAAPTAFKAEKCYGVAKAGHNDCAAGSHACGGLSKVSGDGASWIFVPAGTCEKINGASLTPKKA